jgi:tetrahydrodipicolinate N-succinyltransferase
LFNSQLEISVPKTIPNLSAKSRMVNGRGVAVTVTVLVGAGVLVSVGVAVGNAVLVGKGVFVGTRVGVGVGVTPQAARAKPIDDVPSNFKKSRRVRCFIVDSFLFCASDSRAE